MEIDESSTPESWDPEEMGEVVNWSSDDVSAYFTSQGFSDEAAIMKEQVSTYEKKKKKKKKSRIG
jgi:hypothetical protein